MARSEYKTIILEPSEYRTAFGLRPTGGHFIPLKGLWITRDGVDTWVRTAFNVDSGCRIALTWSGKGVGKVKHLTSTPRRKYYMALLWYSVILMLIAWIFTLIEVGILGNPAIGDSRTKYSMLKAFTAWMGLDIVSLRNGRGFTKWAVTIFSYFIMLMSTGSFVVYLFRLIQGS